MDLVIEHAADQLFSIGKGSNSNSAIYFEHYTKAGSPFYDLYTKTSEDGFLVVPTNDKTNVFYVSSSEGNDKNDCQSEVTPCKTIKHALSKTEDKRGDHVLLKRGDTWRDECGLWISSGVGEDKPFVLSFYGETGKRPKLECDNKFFSPNLQISWVAILGIEFSAYKLDTTSVSFTGLVGDSADVLFLGDNRNLIFEDNKFNYSELILQGSKKGSPQNIVLRRNIWTGAYYGESSLNRKKRPSNIFLHTTENLIAEENVIDSGGWNKDVRNAGANQFNHNVYIQHNSNGNSIYFLNNIITRASSHGIHGRPGGIFQNNFFAKNAIGLQLGYKNHPLVRDTVAIALNNVIQDGESMVKGDNACFDLSLCTPALWGLRLEELKNSNRVAVIGNVIGPMSTENGWKKIFKKLNAEGISHDSSIDDVYFLNNITWAWSARRETNFHADENFRRDLAHYAKTLGLEESFDAFMQVVLNRPMQTWDVRFSANSINSFIRSEP